MTNETIQIGDKTYIKAKIIALPTVKTSKLVRNTYRFTVEHGNPLEYHEEEIFNAIARGYEYLHLYFINNNKIEDLDDVDVNTPLLFKADNNSLQVITYSNRRIKTPGEYYKIIACTDESLWEHDDTVPFPRTRPVLPRPSNSFLEAYCKANEGIEHVLIEIIPRSGFIRDKTQRDSPLNGFNYNHVKTTPDNTITVKPVKNGWNREEMEEIHLAIMKQGCLYEGGKWSKEHEKLVKIEFNKYMDAH